MLNYTKARLFVKENKTKNRNFSPTALDSVKIKTIIMSVEQVALRLVRPPKAGNTIKTALFNRFYGVQTLFNAYPRHAARRMAR